MRLEADTGPNVPWLELGVNPDEVEHTLRADAGAFAARFSLGLLRRAFAPAGLGAVLAMTKDEAIRLIARGVQARHEPSLGALRRLALCHRLVSGKREDALKLVEDAVARLDVSVGPGRAPIGMQGWADFAGRERHIALALALLERAPEHLRLFPLLDRASRVSYRTYITGDDTGDDAATAPIDGDAAPRDDGLEQAIARLAPAVVQERLSRAFGSAAPVVDGVYPVRDECFVFLRARGGDRIVATADGALVAADYEQLILRFAADGRLRAYGGAAGVRIAESLVGVEGGVRYRPEEPPTAKSAAKAWVGRLVRGADAHFSIEAMSIDFGSFEVQLSGDVAEGLRALSIDVEGDAWFDRVRSFGLLHRSSAGTQSRYTVSIEPGSGPGSVAFTYRASGAPLWERDEFEGRLAAHGVRASSR